MLTGQSLPVAKRLTILSSCCGVTGEVVLTDSAVILLYATVLCAGDAFALVTTAVLPLLNGLLIIPMAGFIRFCDCRKLVLLSNLFALPGYLVTASAAFFPEKCAAGVLLGGIIFFAVCQTAFVSGWLPFLNMFLPASDRTVFLGTMRFLHQLSAISFLGLVGLLIGKQPKIEILSLVLAAGALIFAGRILFISRIRCIEEPERKYPDFTGSLKMALTDPGVVKFSIYTLILNIGSGAVIPLTLLDIKKQHNLADNQLVILSILIFLGMMLGYILVPKIEKKLGRYGTFLILHVLIFLSIIGILITRTMAYGFFVTAFSLMLCNACIAANSVVASSEIMQRVSMGNQVIMMALWGAFFYGGNGFSRIVAGVYSSCSMPNQYILLIDGIIIGIGLFFLRSIRKIHLDNLTRKE